MVPRELQCRFCPGGEYSHNECCSSHQYDVVISELAISKAMALLRIRLVASSASAACRLFIESADAIQARCTARACKRWAATCKLTSYAITLGSGARWSIPGLKLQPLSYFQLTITMPWPAGSAGR